MAGRDIEKALERIADALEKLASDPEVDVEFGPPICPECGQVNPMIRIPAQEEMEGPMVELVTQGECLNCGSQLFIATESYSVHKSYETVKSEIEHRRAGLQ